MINKQSVYNICEELLIELFHFDDSGMAGTFESNNVRVKYTKYWKNLNEVEKAKLNTLAREWDRRKHIFKMRNYLK